MKQLTALLVFLSVPRISFAQFNAAPVGGYISSVTAFVNGYIIPLIMAAAIVVFIWGMFQYFILGGTSDEKREKGKQLLIWSVIAFVLMLSIQGIVMLFADSLGFSGGTITPPSTFKI